MTFRSLLDAWAGEPAPVRTREAYSIRLTSEDAARIKALAELFPGVDEERIITDLLGAALEQTVAAIPYEAGDKVIREDEYGDPIYEDVGLMPRFMEFVKRHRAEHED